MADHDSPSAIASKLGVTTSELADFTAQQLVEAGMGSVHPFTAQQLVEAGMGSVRPFHLVQRRENRVGEVAEKEGAKKSRRDSARAPSTVRNPRRETSAKKGRRDTPSAARALTNPSRNLRSPTGARAVARLFGTVPLFMREEDPARLMRHAPPYGFKFGSFVPATLERMRANATIPEQAMLGSCAVVGSSGTLLQHREPWPHGGRMAVGWRSHGGITTPLRHRVRPPLRVAVRKTGRRVTAACPPRDRRVSAA